MLVNIHVEFENSSSPFDVKVYTLMKAFYLDFVKNAHIDNRKDTCPALALFDINRNTTKLFEITVDTLSSISLIHYFIYNDELLKYNDYENNLINALSRYNKNELISYVYYMMQDEYGIMDMENGLYDDCSFYFLSERSPYISEIVNPVFKIV